MIIEARGSALEAGRVEGIGAGDSRLAAVDWEGGRHEVPVEGFREEVSRRLRGRTGLRSGRKGPESPAKAMQATEANYTVAFWLRLAMC